MTMIPPQSSLLKYDNAMLASDDPKGLSRKGNHQQAADLGPTPRPSKPKSPAADATKQQNEEILNSILPPRTWMEGNKLWIQQVSVAPSVRADVVNLEELLNTKLHQRQAKATGICPIRRELYSQCFDELIRQVTINCPERGVLLMRVQNEIKVTLAAYQALYESSLAFGIRKGILANQGKADMEQKILDLENETVELKKQLNEQKARFDATMNGQIEKQQLKENKHLEEVQFLKKTQQQFKAQLEGIIAPKK